VGLSQLMPQDAAEIAGLEAACFGADAWSPAAVAGALERAGGVGWALRVGAEATAYLLAAVLFEDAELLRIGVAPGHRGEGHGDTLLRAFAAEAAARGAARLLLEVRADNAPAHALYRRNGWAPVGRRPRYYADGGDALLFERPAGP
jgi:ribosomal-protein-alanine N-acetyltransferase